MLHTRKNIRQNTRARSTCEKIQLKTPECVLYEKKQHIFFLIRTLIQHKHNTGRKYITQNLAIPERAPHAEQYNTIFHNTSACSTRVKDITQNSTKPKRVPHTEQYNTTFQKTRVRSKCGRIQHKIPQY